MEERLGLVFAARVVVEGGKMAKEATVSDHNVQRECFLFGRQNYILVEQPVDILIEKLTKGRLPLKKWENVGIVPQDKHLSSYRG